MPHFQPFVAIGCGLLLLLAAGCAGEDIGSSVNSTQSAPGAFQPTNSAILVAAFVRNPDGRNIYVGAAPEVPSGKLDYSKFVEFDSVDVYTANGFVYVWERDPATMTRYIVNQDLQLEQAETLSFLSYGLSGGGVPAFASEHLAYVLSPQLDVIVRYDPTTMEFMGTIDVAPLDRPMLDSYGVDVFRFGSATAWLLNSENGDSQKIHRGVTLLLVRDDATHAQFVEDDRCAGGDGARVDENGDLYVRAGASWGMYAAYGDEAKSVRTCMLCVRKGETTFDPNYLLDFKELTGSYVNGPWFHLEGTRYIANVWTDQVPIPEDPEKFWNGEGYRTYLVDTAAKTAERYHHLDDSVIVSSIEFKLDGVAYDQLSTIGTAVNGSADIVELHPDRIEKRFEIPELWAFGRIR